MNRPYCVDYMSKWTNRWSQIDAFEDVYEAIDYAVKMSKEETDPHKIRGYDFAAERTILRLEII